MNDLVFREMTPREKEWVDDYLKIIERIKVEAEQIQPQKTKKEET